MLLEVALLRRGQRLVEEHGLRVVAQHQRLDLVGLAAADEERRIGRLAARDHPRHRPVTGGFCKQCEFVERIVEGGLLAEIDTDEHGLGRPARGATMRGEAGLGGPVGRALQDCSLGSLTWKFTARPGTTVEMACL